MSPPPFPIKWIPSPHHYRGRRGHTLDTVVMHYDVVRHEPAEVVDGRIFQGHAEKSATFGIGRGGGVAQYVDVDDAAWHAGDGGMSRMPTTQQLEVAIATGTFFVPIGRVPPMPTVMNCRSAGIEHGNRGYAPRGPNKYGEARHRNPASRETLWESWSDEQIDRSIQLVRWLVQIRPTLRWITGHEDLCHADTLGDDPSTPEVERKAGAKLDPGPLFPWAVFSGLGLKRVRYDFGRHGWAIENGSPA